MENKIEKIKKRDGEIVNFDPKKIITAIYKSTEGAGEPNYDLAQELSKRIVKILKEKLPAIKIPIVEEIQDIVEKVLVEAGQAKVAKAYILYRQKRAQIRKEKQQILNKTEIDEVDKRFDTNALRVLCSRYLKKDTKGNIIESPKQLFERVAVHTALPSLFYDKRVFQKKGETFSEEKFEPKKIAGKIKIGQYQLNVFHLRALKRLYDMFNQRGQMRIPWEKFLKMLEKGEFKEYSQEIEIFYNLMTERKFMPNTPTLANFGNYLGMGSACFVLGIKDSIESIMETLMTASIIFKSGGGVGYNFSDLRPEGDFVKASGGVSSGPISFMTLYDKMSDVVKQGGLRRGASIGILDSNHPDIEKFIIAKRGNLQLRNFNISVFIKKDFWDYYEEKKPYPLVNPRSGEIVKYIDPKALFDLIVYQSWESGEPGVIFEDHINKYNPFLETLGPIRATNPCGELPLYPNESCNLGSINVWAFCKSNPTNGRDKKVEFDWESFKQTIKLATRFLDNVVDVNKYPLPEIKEKTLDSRKLGLGIMGLADLLFELEISYNSKQGFDFMESLMTFLNYYSKETSVELAKERGAFPFYEKSFYPEGRLPFKGEEKEPGELPLDDVQKIKLDWKNLKEKIKKHKIRNAHTTTNAPTGSISMITGCSSGIEPNFSLVFEKKVSIGTFYYVNPVFEKTMERAGLLDEDLIREVSEREGGIKDISYIPPKWKKVFVTSMDILAKDHVKALAILQKWVDSSISKTINFPQSATIEDMKNAYLLAHKLGCKDLTVFRDKSIKGVLKAGVREKKKSKTQELVSLKDVKAKGPSIYKEAGVNQDVEIEMERSSDKEIGNQNSELCPKCKTSLMIQEGCKKCPNCGWSLCVG